MKASKSGGTVIKRGKAEKAFTVFNYIFFILLSIVMVYPFWHVIMMSFSSVEATAKGGVFLYPQGFNLDTYAKVFKDPSIWTGYATTIGVTVLGTVFGTLFTATTAYPLSKANQPFQKTLNFLILFTMLFSGGLVPTYLLIKNLGLYNSPWALVLPAAVNVYNMLIIKNYYESLPDSLEESAKLDGAGTFTILIRIILPLSKPVIATILLFEMVAFWNDYYNAMIYITDINLKTLQLYMAEIVMEAQQDQTTDTEDDIMNTSPEGMQATTILASAIHII